MPNTDWSDELKNNKDVGLYQDGTGMFCKRCKVNLKVRKGRLFQSYTWTEHQKSGQHKSKAVSDAGKLTSFYSIIDSNKRAKQADHMLNSVKNVKKKCPGIYPSDSNLFDLFMKYGNHSGGQYPESIKLTVTAEGSTLHAFDCTNKYTIPHDKRVRVNCCNECKKVYTASFRKHFLKMKNIEEVLAIKAQPICRKTDVKVLQNFLKNSTANKEKTALMKEIRQLVEWIRWISENQGTVAQCMSKKLDRVVETTSGLIPNVDKFLSDVIEATQQDPTFNESLAYGMLQCHMVKMKGRMNAPYTKKLLNFAQVIRLKSPKTYHFIESNMLLPSARHLSRLKTSISPTGHMFDLSPSAMSNRLKDWISKMKIRTESTTERLVVSISIDASKLNKKYEIQSGYGYGKAFPNHMEIIDEQCNLLDKMTWENETKKDELADEVKCVLLSAHNSVPDVSPVKVIAGRPGKTNEVCNDFTTNVLDLVSCHDDVIAITVAFDGLSSEAIFTRNQIYNFLMGKTDVIGVMDMNHGQKSLRSQIVLGSSIKEIGGIVIDQGLFQLTPVKIPIDWYKVSDYSSDILVLKLCSHETIQKILNITPADEVDINAIAVLCKYY